MKSAIPSAATLAAARSTSLARGYPVARCQEVRDRRHAARNCGRRTARVVVGADAQMGVGIDSPRNHEQTFRIDFLGAVRCRKVLADLDDRFAANAEVGFVATFRRHDRPVADDNLSGLLCRRDNRDRQQHE